MIIRNKAQRARGLHEPFLHENHARPVTRRDFIGAGLLTGPAVITAPAWLGALLKSGNADATLASDMTGLFTQCSISAGSGKVPFICFDLAGGANLIGSEVLMGVQGGQTNFLSAAGYSKLGLPGNMLPNQGFVSTALGLAFHSDAAILRGIQSVASAGAQANTNGAVIAAMSQNDTGNNPHNPMYAIAAAGSKGKLLTLVGTQSTVSGGNSAAPTALVDPTLQPTKIAQASDDTGLAGGVTVTADGLAVLQSQARISGGTDPTTVDGKVGELATGDSTVTSNLTQQVRCAYVRNANNADAFTPTGLNPDLDSNIVGTTGIFSTATYNGDSDIRKTAAVMKLVVNGFAGAGTITLGGYDYHDSTRASGEQKNFHAGVCIGAVLEYARRVGSPVMIYVFSDGSLSSTGMADTTTQGRNKLGWQGDNQSTSSTFFLVYSPNGRPVPRNGTAGQQIGYFNADGSVNTMSNPAANAVNLLVQTVMLNYMALNGDEGVFDTKYQAATKGMAQGLGAPASRDLLTAFSKIT